MSVQYLIPVPLVFMMTMIVPNSPVHQKEGAQWEEEEEAGGSTGTPTPGADALTDPTRSGMSDARNRRNMDDGEGFHSKGGAEGARN